MYCGGCDDFFGCGRKLTPSYSSLCAEGFVGSCVILRLIELWSSGYLGILIPRKDYGISHKITD
jgi:hypothetical protein